MTSNSLTENAEHDIPSQMLKTILRLQASVIFRSQYVWFLTHLWGPAIPNSSVKLTELMVYVIPPE